MLRSLLPKRKMSTLQERQEQRKERLMQLKAIAAESGGQGEKSLKRGNDGEHSSLRFRSYQPESTELQGFIQQAPAVGPAANESGVDTVESRGISWLLVSNHCLLFLGLQNYFGA